jgi:hypothetical protein
MEKQVDKQRAFWESLSIDDLEKQLEYWKREKGECDTRSFMAGISDCQNKINMIQKIVKRKRNDTRRS